MRYLFPLGRILYAFIFITASPRHFSAEGIQHAADLGVPLAGLLVPASGILAIAGGLSVILGYRARLGAWALVAFLVPVTFMMHAFWAVHDPALARVQQAMFAKNISMLGAALLITQFGLEQLASMSENETLLRSEAGAQRPCQFVQVDNVRIAYTDHGSSNSPALICLHAIGHGARDFEDLSQRLSDSYRVVAIDFPGQGNSGPDTVAASGTRYTELLARVVDLLGLEQFAILGNSIGGAAAVRYASLHPERVKALILCDSGGLRAARPIERLFIRAFVQFFAAGRRRAKWFPWAFSRYYRTILRESPAHAQRDRIIRSAYEIAPALEQAWRSFADPREDLSGFLTQIECPVLLAWAKRDWVIPLKAHVPIFPNFYRHRLELFEGGHAAFLEDPDRFERVLRDFMAGLK